MHAVSQACALIALKRGENAELATIAGLLHDIASLKNHDIEPFKTHGLTSANHAEKGAGIAMEILVGMNITTLQENEIICSAIRKHSDKDVIDTPFDEVLKDADVLAHGISNIDSRNFRGCRWDKVCQEFGIDNLR
jgi:HD superfamily phosphodiesterase